MAGGAGFGLITQRGSRQMVASDNLPTSRGYAGGVWPLHSQPYTQDRGSPPSVCGLSTTFETAGVAAALMSATIKLRMQADAAII